MKARLDVCRVRCVLCVLQVDYGLNSYGGPSLTHHALPFSIQGGPNFIVSQAGCSMHRADLDPPPPHYPSATLHPPEVKTLPSQGRGPMAHASMMDSSPVDLSGHKMVLGHKGEEHHQHFSQPDVMARHYPRGDAVALGMGAPNQSHGKSFVCEWTPFH